MPPVYVTWTDQKGALNAPTPTQTLLPHPSLPDDGCTIQYKPSPHGCPHPHPPREAGAKQSKIIDVRDKRKKSRSDIINDESFTAETCVNAQSIATYVD